MIAEAFNSIFYGAVFVSLFTIDYFLGNGFLDAFQTIFCKIACFIKKEVREEAKQVQITGPENPISLPILLTEILVLSLTMAYLKRYKRIRGKDQIDELLYESQEALRQTNEFLDKWRLRRINNWQAPKYTYLDGEQQDTESLKLEVPILHMTIIDTQGTNENQSGIDAGDSINVTDSPLISVTSLLDEDTESITDVVSDEKIIDIAKSIKFKNRYLWDVMEEDDNTLDD